jgi:hypothetical protein
MAESYQREHARPQLSDEALCGLVARLSREHATRSPEAGWQRTEAALRRWRRDDRIDSVATAAGRTRSMTL